MSGPRVSNRTGVPAPPPEPTRDDRMMQMIERMIEIERAQALPKRLTREEMARLHETPAGAAFAKALDREASKMRAAEQAAAVERAELERVKAELPGILAEAEKAFGE